MLGTFGGALEARKIDASDGRLTAEVRGEIESEDGCARHPPNSCRHETSRSSRSARHGRSHPRIFRGKVPRVQKPYASNPDHFVVQPRGHLRPPGFSGEARRYCPELTQHEIK